MSCLVNLPNYQHQTYTEGSVLNGTVVCWIPHQIKVTGVMVKLKGKERNKWKESYGEHTCTYSDTVKFIRNELILQPKRKLGPGTFEYPFTFQLPSGSLLNSYHGPYGGIRYTVDAKVDIPFAPDYTDKKEITVFHPVDLNKENYQGYWAPAKYSVSKLVSSWCCCVSGSVTMDVYLEKRCFVPGEQLRVQVHVTNQSDTDVDEVSAKIKRRVTSRILSLFENKHRDDVEEIAISVSRGVKARYANTYDLKLPIPEDTKVLNFHGSRLFEQETMLSVTALFYWQSNLKVKTELVMGHIPVGGPHHNQPPDL
ncbi:hypothetical protein NQ315_007424 [Exocentrus adspersus]|uniref:Arrestin C-terminal-like domain-containing protein n=1 Tax=Exocentrus adspersus TaxID=1586481 RepID=A0AAV8VI01_9CUCU|nr:hypothetical protein NQ315_007424 [Exocentrus adspersus]